MKLNDVSKDVVKRIETRPTKPKRVGGPNRGSLGKRPRKEKNLERRSDRDEDETGSGKKSNLWKSKKKGTGNARTAEGTESEGGAGEGRCDGGRGKDGEGEGAREKRGVVGRKGEAEYPGVGNPWLDRGAARMALRAGKLQQLAMTARWGRVEHVSLEAP